MSKPEAKTRTHVPGSLVWIDLEMTGLDVNVDVIVQAALIVTDRDLNPIEEFVADIWQPEHELERMTPFVREMHTKTGLLDRVRKSRIDVREAEKRMLERIAGLCPYPAIVCGNTIWQDRKFIDKYMPGLAAYLHYRMLDVSALKVTAQHFYGPSVAFSKSKEGEHDALVDIRNSIAELRHYRGTILR